MKKQKNYERKYVLVFNATTIIVLRELQREKLVEEIRKQGIAKIVIPQGVIEEFQRAGMQVNIPNDDVRIEQMNTNRILDIPQSLGEGERQAITIAYTLTRTQDTETVMVVTDDLKARKTCRRLGLNVIGTLGLIEFAKKHNIITKEEALNLLESIPNTSLYISPELLEKARIKLKQQGKT